jgi:hypothetical protein
MLNQYLYTKADKHQSADGLDFIFKKVTEFFADTNAEI